ncbi:VirD4-like conjugal transfer protein, CD1115 family [Blautia wexlerae]|uniref:VirD4-like conjugal transfer protein, CD1115 family n=1 Tax=Blautia wexlerae TaxID=418240 RepID=UPI003A7F59A2
MPVTNSRKSDWVIWLAGLPVIWWVAILLADAIQPGRNLFELMEVLTEKLNHPFQFHYTEYTIKSMLVCTLLYAAGIGIFYSSQKNYRRGEEHGSARWGDARQICKKYSQKPYSQNILLTQNFRISLDTHKHRRCLNILVVGGSGAGKSRGFALPNIMQCCCSMVITDPKAELLRKTGGLLEKKGYEVRVFDLINPDTSFCYNPFEYVHDDKDVLRLISNLIQNTTPKGSQSSDPFWEKSETALLQALMLYLLHEAPPEEQNFAMIMEMLGSAQVKEEDEDYESPLDILFDRLEMRDPDSIAVKQYHIYKQAAGKTAKSILISVGVRLAAFNLPQIAKLTNTDELDLSSMGEKKVALFCCIPDADTSLNYLVGMIYSQLFQTLYYMADRVHGGALPVPVNCIMDEFPNVSLPNEFEKILATCRSRSIYCSIIIQNMSQLKALFKDSWESLVGNCDEFLYLGGNEKETHKYVSELLGKETIDTNTYGQTKGKSGSYSTNFQQSGRELLQPDEVRMLDNQNALLFIRGERPILDAKYDLMKHPNIRYTEDGGAGPFNYAKAPLAHDDFTFDETRYNDYELLLDEDIIGELF